MDVKKVLTLATLLNRAMRSVVIKRSSSNERLDIGIYKRNLRKCWDSYNPDMFSYLNVLTYEPDIKDTEVREEVLHFIRSELAQYIHGDKIQTAACSIVGGLGNGFPLEYLLKQLLKVTIVRGEQYTAQAFCKCIDDTYASYQMIGLLSGVRVEQELQVSQGVRLISLPTSTSDLPPYFSPMGHLSALDLLGRTLIVVDCSVSPIFKNPSFISTIQDVEQAFRHEIVCTDYPDFNIDEFCEALSLTCEASIQNAAVWSYLRDDEIFNMRASYGGGHFTPSLLHERHSVPVSEANIKEAMSLYHARKTLKPKVAMKLKVPIDRWINSKAKGNTVDAFIDLGIALESLFLEDIQNSGEFRFRLSLRAAWYLGENMEKRQSLMREFRKIYDLRSSAVHTGDIASDESTPEFTQRAQDLCRQSIVKVIDQGQFPDWNRLVLGHDVNTY